MGFSLVSLSRHLFLSLPPLSLWLKHWKLLSTLHPCGAPHQLAVHGLFPISLLFLSSSSSFSVLPLFPSPPHSFLPQSFSYFPCLASKVIMKKEELWVYNFWFPTLLLFPDGCFEDMKLWEAAKIRQIIWHFQMSYSAWKEELFLCSILEDTRSVISMKSNTNIWPYSCFSYFTLRGKTGKGCFRDPVTRFSIVSQERCRNSWILKPN